MTAYIAAKNIDVSAIQFSGNRIGSYYLPQGVDLKNAGVIYDRDYSSFACLQPSTINWDIILQDITWLHFSAISPALNENTAAICKEALIEARKKGITISIDLNYRSKLWQYGMNPVSIMPELVTYCNVVMGNLWAVESLLGIRSVIKESTGKTNQELISATGESMKSIHLTFSSVSTIAYTFRLDKSYFAVMQHGRERVISKEIELRNTIDRVGSGDCFMAGLIFGLTNNHPLQDIIDYSAFAAVEKLYEKGDATTRTEKDIRAIMNR
ncbi:MAG: PfkB family carbohydrate kinase [Chitinophagaceae bacterium]